MALCLGAPTASGRDAPHMEGSAWPDLSIPAATSRTGIHDAAVVVGIGEYHDFSPIPGATDMAEEWATFLRQSLGVPKRRLIVLLDETASAEAMAGAVSDLAPEVEDGGTLWFIFAGHGILAGDPAEPLLLGFDAPMDMQQMPNRGMTTSQLRALCESGSQSRTVVVLDTGFGVRDFYHKPLVPDLTLSDLTPHLASWPQAVILLSRAPDELRAVFPGLDRPPFGYLLLGALRGWADADENTMITAREAMDYVASTTHMVLPDSALHPQLLGQGGNILSASREPGPDIYQVLWLEAEQRIARRQQKLDLAESRLREKAREDWASLQPQLKGADPDARHQLRAFLDRYQHPATSIDGMNRWVVLREVHQARAMYQELGGDDEPTSDDLAFLQQELVQLCDEMKQLARRNTWKGVEDKYQQALALAARGVPLDFETLYLAAQAARGLGQINLAYERLIQATEIEARDEAVAWLNDMELNFTQVKLRNQRREPVLLSALHMPFAPDQRATITLAWEQVEETGVYDGLLPRGVYNFGEKTFLAVPGDPVSDVVLSKEKRKQEKDR